MFVVDENDEPINMMKLVQIFTSLLIFCVCSFSALRAQSSTEAVRDALDAGLKEYVNEIHPKKGCECNECAHTYKGSFKITKHSSVQGTLRINAVAKVHWENAFTAGEDVIPIYAEFKKVDGEVVMTKLKWRKAACMSFEVLYQEVGG